VSEVADQGKALVQRNCPTATPAEIEESYHKVRSFIRQGETFYRAARGTPYRSSALLYYYAFLNFTKAVLEVRGVRYQSTHGLTARPTLEALDLNLQEIEVWPTEVFPSLYGQEFGGPLPANIRLQLRPLLAYVTEIGFQHEAGGLGDGAVKPGHGRFFTNTANNTGWVAIAVDRSYSFSLLPEPNRSTFDATFQEVTMPKEKARESFGIFAEDLDGYRFYEMRTPIDVSSDVSVDVDILIRCLCYPLEGILEPNLISGGFDFSVSRPLITSAGTFKMIEPVAIYLVTFFLGSLVRYHPYYLEDLLGSNASWLLESFTGSAPLTMLRWFLCRITGDAYVFNK
jgi:hypothetical protein